VSIEEQRDLEPIKNVNKNCVKLMSSPMQSAKSNELTGIRIATAITVWGKEMTIANSYKLLLNMFKFLCISRGNCIPHYRCILLSYI